MRVLLLSRYSRLGASSRLRTLQYLSTPAFADFDVRVEPLFDDRYLKARYSGNNAGSADIAYLIRRMALLAHPAVADVVWMEYEALPWLPWLAEATLLPALPIVSDYDDAIFHRYDRHRLMPVRAILGRKIAALMRRSDVVVAGNDYLAAYARQVAATRVEIVPTVVDIDRFDRSCLSTRGESASIGWIGTPHTWSELAQRTYSTILPVLEEFDGTFRAIGARLERNSRGRLECIPWSEESECAMIGSFDIGIMPLPDTPWTRGKCGYKLIQYMAAAVPVVASPVGVNRDIVEHGVNGFLASSDEEWRLAITTLLSDRGLRQRMGEAGRLKVEREYSLQVWAPRLAGIIKDVVEGSRRA